MKKARSLLYVKLYGESDAATIFFNFARLAIGIWDLKSRSQWGDPKENCHKIWVYCIQTDRTEPTN